MSGVRIVGAREVIEHLGAMPGEFRKAARNSLNKGATQARKAIVDPAVAATGIKRAVLNARLPLSKAGLNDLISRVKADPHGIPAPAYRWHHVPTGKHPTRHRIMIGWPGGEKVAAGFVNPFGTYQAPLTTRRKGYDLAIALAPSAASLRYALFQDAEERKVSGYLQDEFKAQLINIINKRPVDNE